MQKIKIIFGVFFLTCIVLWGASPYWVLYQINQAIQQNQPEKISQYIDFPLVRENLKKQIKQSSNKYTTSHQHQIFEKYTDVLTTTLAEHIVDIVVTPDNLTLLIKAKQLNQHMNQHQLNQMKNILAELNGIASLDAQDSHLSLTSNQQTAVEKSEMIKAHYVSMNTFQVIIPLEYLGHTKFIMQRNALQWKIVKIQSTKLLS